MNFINEGVNKFVKFGLVGVLNNLNIFARSLASPLPKKLLLFGNPQELALCYILSLSKSKYSIFMI